jgi:hypothetical protein
MARKSLRELARLFIAEKVGNPAAVAALRLAIVGTDKRLRFVAFLTIGATEYECAADNGKIKTFGDLDDFLKYTAKAAEVGNGVYSLEVDTGAVLASAVPNDVVAWSEAQIVRLNKVKTGQNAVIAAIDTQLALMVGWDTGNTAQQAKLAETQAQRACVVTDVAAIDTEIARLTLIVA